MLENLVFTALRRVTPKIWYCRTKSGLEVDFLAQTGNRSHASAGTPPSERRMLVQVCESMVEPRTRKREIAALAEAMEAYGLNTGTIVTRSEGERIEVGPGVIEVVPVWRFLLNLPG